jgi:putative two-component system response regulator
MAVARPIASENANLTPVAVPALPSLFRNLLQLGIISASRSEKLSPDERVELWSAPDDDAVIEALLGHQLLTPFQAGRIRAGQSHTLILGNYRVLDKIGAGGMGVVFRAEHLKFHTPWAIKALYLNGEKNRRAVERFFHEVRAVTKLKHPHIVAAEDAGEQAGASPDRQAVPYLVMEYIVGRNLEDWVMADGPLGIGEACLAVHQIADALTEAHRHGVVHRDVKPGNILLAEAAGAKLLDFGVARLPNPDDRLTKDGARLGTISYMAPEQVRSAKDADARSDIFGLGATLYFALTGRDPFDPPAGAAGAFRVPSARQYRSEVPPELDIVLSRMMCLNPHERTPSAAEAMRQLMPFLAGLTAPDARDPRPRGPINVAETPIPDASPSPHRVLIVDDQPDVRRVCKLALAGEGVRCDEVGDGPAAFECIAHHDFDLILLDVDLPGMSGEAILRQLRANPPSPHLKVIMLSGRASGDDLSRLMLAGADDFLTKPFSLVQLRARTKTALRFKDAQDRTETLTRHLMQMNGQLEAAVSSKDGELLHARGAMVLALAKLVESRSAETGQHLIRLQKYSRVLAEAAAATPAYALRLDHYFIQTLEDCAPLHDIGKAAVPDYILNKPGRLDAQERLLMEAHTTNGADTLLEVARKYQFATGFLQMSIDIARHHHERWDGSGYPDRLAGEAIPLAARLIALCDVYDALRSRRVYKPALSHNMAVMTMTEASPGHFDPSLLAIFRTVGEQFDAIFRATAD